MADRPKVVILGCGFGGLGASQGLKKAAADVTVLDRNDYHTPESVNSMSALITSGGMKAKCVASRVQRIASCARAGGTSIVAGVR
jgi:NADH dehydrogenase